jgi:uncharacterized GH25 family protein
MIRKLGFLAAAFALLVPVATTTSAAAARKVRVVVVDASDVPVANARILVSAEEMDAIGTTDSAGSVQFTTRSSSVEVRAEKGSRKASATSAAETIKLRLTEGAQ